MDFICIRFIGGGMWIHLELESWFIELGGLVERVGVEVGVGLGLRLKLGLWESGLKLGLWLWLRLGLRSGLLRLNV
jgi:hypothetical protein